MKSKLRYLLTSLYFGLIGVAAMAGPAFAGCVYVEGGVGGSMARDRLSSGSAIDLNQTGALASLGLFCRVMGPVAGATGWFVDLGGRGDLMASKGDLGGVSIKSTEMLEALVRLGYRYHEKIEVFAQSGAAWTDIKLPSGLGTKNPLAWDIGAGIRGHVNGGWWLGLSGDYYMGRKVDVSGADLTQDSLAARVTLTYFFGEPLQAQRPLK